MISKKYLEEINIALNKMDRGFYPDALEDLLEIINNDLFTHLNLKDKLFIKKRTAWIQLSLGQYEDGWKNFTYNWIKNIKKFEKIKEENNSINYLISLNQIKKNEKLIIWNDGGYGDYIYQLRLLKYLERYLSFKIYTTKIDHLLRNKDLITRSSKNFNWHLPINEIPRILNFNPRNNLSFDFDYLIKPSNDYLVYENHVALTYKTETSVTKSINYKYLKLLFKDQKNTKFLILQSNINEDERNFFSKFKNVNYIKNLDNLSVFHDTFHILNSVRYVISVDTAITHIAGYLGKKNYLLLKNPSSFYWGFDGKESYDYKNHLLFRQEKSGDWNTVLKKLSKYLN
tara:strand:+ start:3453 stop:4481 length:1029 start_codon:yes stop_codon:yes gene_type:complete